jgi:opacity protein-like surface antigen
MHRVLVLVLLLPIVSSAEPRTFVRVGLGLEGSADTRLRDADCSAARPPALFGCGFEARGDLGSAPVFEAGAGIELAPRMRAEVTLSHRELELDAQANFTGVAGEQPVRADVQSSAALLTASMDLAPLPWRVRPFLTTGIGIARHTTGEVTFGFPGIAPNAVTVLEGGTHTAFAWTGGVGASVALSPRLHLDVTARFDNLGEFRTGAGAATIVRPTRTLRLTVDATRADVKSTGVVASLRWRL